MDDRVRADFFHRYFVHVLLISLMVPREFYFKLFDLLLSPYRFVLILSFPYLAFKYFEKRASHFAFTDLFVFLFSLWGVLSHIVNSGFAGTVSAGMFVIETAVPYLAGRYCISEFGSFARFAKFYCISIVVFFFIAALESISVNYLVHGLSGQISGQAYTYDIDPRWGLGRAMGPFDHPILYGTYCAGAFGLIWFGYGGVKKFIMAGVSTGAVFWSMSSGPLLGVVIQGAFIAYERVTRPFRHRVLYFLAGFSAFALFLQVISDRPVVEILVNKLTLEPQTAWFRFAIWHYASETIADYPIFGIAYQASLYDSRLPEWMQLGLNENFSSSVDCFILLNTLFYGLPGGAFLLLSAVTSLFRVGTATLTGVDTRLHRARMGWACSLVGLCFVSITVHYWNAMHVFFFLFLGSGIWLGNKVRSAPPAMPARRDVASPEPVLA